MSLVFRESNHSYRLDGKPVPGVTTLLGKGLPKPALPRWAAKSAAEYVADNLEVLNALPDRESIIATVKQSPWTQRDRAAVRGTDIHALAEELAHGRPADVPDDLVTVVDGYVRWLDAWQPEMIWTERPVANRRWWYAGKPDAVCRIGSDVWLLDWKSAKGVYGDNALQVACYANSEFSVTPEGDEEPMPHIDRLGVVHVTPHGTELYEVNDPAAAWKDALHVMWTAKAIDRINGYISDPLTVAVAS